MGVVGLWGLLIGSFAILSASVSSESSHPEYSDADGESPALILEVEHLKGKTARLKGKLGDLRALVEEEKRLRAEKAEENAALRRRLGDVEGRLTRVESAAKAMESWKERTEGQLGCTMGVPTGNVSTASVVNAPAWELGGLNEFSVKKAMGVWYHIEKFERSRPSFSVSGCNEYRFDLRGTTIQVSQKWDRREDNFSWTPDTQFPYKWRDEYLNEWKATDYNNWGVFVWCNTEELSSCHTLFIMSRKRTLPPPTLEMLRNSVEKYRFQKDNGFLLNQTSC